MSSVDSTKKSIRDILSREDIDTIAQAYTNDKTVQVLRYEIEDFWRARASYARTYKRLKITLLKLRSSNSETVSFFLKLIPYDLEAARDFSIDKDIFLKESNFYNKIVPNLRNSVYSQKWIATCFLAKDDALVLEDLTSKDYRIFGNKMLDNMDALKSALISLAQFHCSSIIVESRLNRNTKRPITLYERYADILKESYLTRTESMLQRILIPCMNVTCALAKHFSYDPELIRRAHDKVCDMVKPSSTYRNVICHGELWSNNLVFSDDPINVYKCILVDFQMVRYAPIATDLLQLLHLNTSRMFRNENEKDLIVFYHSFLEKTIKENDVTESVIVPTLEEISEGINEFRLFGLFAAAIYSPIALMDPSDLADYTKDADSYEAFMFGDRVGLTMDYLEKDESYKIRVGRCIVDLAEKIMTMDHENKQAMMDSMNDVVSPVDVAIVAQKFTKDESIIVLDYSIGEYVDEKLGISAVHKILDIKFQKSKVSDTESASFFVKSVPYSIQVQVDYLVGAGIFLKESRFFRRVIPELIANCKCEKWYPDCYLAKEDAIILENLKDRGYKMINTNDDMTALKSALVSLARLHGSSMLLEESLKRKSEKRTSPSYRYSDIFHETVFITGIMAKCLSNIFEVTCTLARNFGYNPDNLRRQFDRMYELVKQSKTHRNVVCHGDLGRNNLMFDEKYNCVFVDFQHVRYAPIATDLLQFLHLNATRTFRGNHERKLVEFYHSNLEKVINDNKMAKIVKVPTTEEIFTSMDELRLVGLVTACCYFPVALIDPKTAAEHGQDPNFLKNVFTGENLDFVMSYIKINESYKKRLEEAVVELAEHIELFHE